MSYVILVDSHDQPLGLMEKLEAHQKGLLHRAFSVFIFSNDEKPKLLLQQRAKNKYHCSGLWTNTCCSHPESGTTLEQAALERLQFEMGIDADLLQVGSFTYHAAFENGLVEYEIDHVLIGFIDADLPIVFNKHEVEDYQWIDLDILESWYDESPELFTPWFKQAYDIAKEG
jgi:isopentenyl-diphosphate delta-isomerase